MRFAAALLALAIAVPAGAAGPEPPLVAATKAGDTAAARNLIEHKADVNARETYSGKTPLALAVENRNTAAAEILKQHGAQ